MKDEDKTREQLIREVAGLRQRVTELDALEADHKWAEERIKHFNVVLRAVRNVNQLITRERDRDHLLQGACDTLIETRGYYNAWIALLDEASGLVATAEAGLGEEFLPLVEQFRRGELSECGRRVLAQSGMLTVEDPLSTCADCPLSPHYAGRGGMTARLEYEGKVYGLMSVSVPREFIASEEEQSLFEEVAGDIAFALHIIELEEERKRMEEALKEYSERLEEMVEQRTRELQDAQAACSTSPVPSPPSGERWTSTPSSRRHCLAPLCRETLRW